MIYWRTRALLCLHIVCVLMELWPLSRGISKTWNRNDAQSGEKVVQVYKLTIVTLASFSFYFFVFLSLLLHPSFTWFTFCVLYPPSVHPSPSLAFRRLTASRFPLYPSRLPVNLLHRLPPSVHPFPPWSEIKTAPCLLHPIWGERWRWWVCLLGGFFVIKLTCAVLTTQMSGIGLCPGSTVFMTHSFVMHWPVHLPLPKHCPGSLPNSVLIHSALRKTQAQNGCHCSCTVVGAIGRIRWLCSNGL